MLWVAIENVFSFVKSFECFLFTNYTLSGIIIMPKFLKYALYDLRIKYAMHYISLIEFIFHQKNIPQSQKFNMVHVTALNFIAISSYLIFSFLLFK